MRVMCELKSKKEKEDRGEKVARRNGVFITRYQLVILMHSIRIYQPDERQRGRELLELLRWLEILDVNDVDSLRKDTRKVERKRER